MRFPARDLTDQYISSSYQDVLQQYLTPTTLYVLDGYGNVVFTLPSASLGNTIITSDITSSMTVLSASYAVTASYLENPDGGYAGMYMDNADYVVNILTQSRWTKVANGWTASYIDPINKFEGNHEIRIGQTGYYLAFWMMAISTGLQASEIEGAVAINHVTQSQLTSHRKTSAGGDLGSFSAGNTLYITSGSTLQLYVRNNSSTTNIVINHGQLAIVRSFAYNSISTESSSSISASYAISASIANFALSSLVSTYSDYSDTSSVAIYSEYAGTASLSAEAISASYSATASYLLGTGTILGGIQFDTASAAAVQKEGYVFWDNENHTLAIKPNITASTLQVGQEMWMNYVAGEDIANGDAIYITTIHDPDGHPVCKRAIADGSRTKYAAVAIATNATPSGSHNLATIQGVVNDLDMSAYPSGVGVFLSNTTPGKYRIGPPSEPYERILLGWCISQDATAGRLLVGIVGIPDVFRAFAGVTVIPSIADNGDGTVTIGTGSVALNTLSTGKGTTRDWSVNSASFSIPLGLTDVSYIVADYNNGNPIWAFTSDSKNIDNIQKVRVYTVTRAVTNQVAWASWDEPGVLLSNKLMDRIVETHGVQRSEGMYLGESGSRYVVVTSGSHWVGVSKNSSDYFNSTSSALALLYHDGVSTYTSSRIYQYINDQYDNGTGLASLNPNRFVVNYVYKSAMNVNRCMIMLSNQYNKLVDAQAAQPPPVPGDMLEGGILVGRAIYGTGLSTATQIDSAFVINFTPSAVMIHNDLTGLQGGNGVDYYHLGSASFSQISSGTSSYAINASTASYVGMAISASHALTASYAENAGGGGTTIESGSTYNITASRATTSISASYSLTASYALNGGGGGGTVIESGSFWNITSSWAQYALTASYIAFIPSGSTESASYALTASYTLAGGLNIANYDYSFVEYQGPYGQFSRCTYRVGGISGSIVSIVDAYYSASLFIGVSKSLG